MTHTTLEGKEIVLAVTGSIAAVETVKLAHELRRRGAGVQAVMSEAAARIVHPDALTYATGRPAITALSGLVEHVQWCGIGGKADLLLVAPCTANTIGKIACGIDDTPVTTFATTALGSGKPVVAVPAMHETMYHHRTVAENLERLSTLGVTVLKPRIEEGRAKIAEMEVIVLESERAVNEKPLTGRRVLITSGPCREPVDDVRVLTTRSTGKMGRALALEAYRRGAEVTVVHADIFPCVRNVRCSSARELHDAVLAIGEREGMDIYVSVAAISDFVPPRFQGKLPSGEPVTLTLDPLPKVIDDVIARYRPHAIAFKLASDADAQARTLLERGAALVVANTPETMGADGGMFALHSAKGIRMVEGSKEEVAAAIWSSVP
ncbi:MAG: bifunctional phosphopantothenoylcysteine decarboxylase/phosphopantothenate--cysteine ligase CoaBC [Methanospirillum sp.]|nr:bifunctional phosphopantothenoylcysteine decarboxylase/phosphopantothenate--cysteine ligase CoaBC [Methanospirillum sp.]